MFNIRVVINSIRPKAKADSVLATKGKHWKLANNFTTSIDVYAKNNSRPCKIGGTGCANNLDLTWVID